MRSELLGVLGGMGPAATAEFLSRLVNLTDSDTDQDHISSITLMLPEVPDRSIAILNGSDAPYEYLKQGTQRLADYGATIIAIPCNSAMHWFTDLEQSTSVPIINIAKQTMDLLAVKQMPCAVLWGTRGLCGGNIFAKALAPDTQLDRTSRKVQLEIDETIMLVKSGQLNKASDLLESLLKNHLRVSGTLPVILGCTELSVAAKPLSGIYPIIDSLDCLALECIRQCGFPQLEPRWMQAL